MGCCKPSIALGIPGLEDITAGEQQLWNVSEADLRAALEATNRDWGKEPCCSNGRLRGFERSMLMLYAKGVCKIKRRLMKMFERNDVETLQRLQAISSPNFLDASALSTDRIQSYDNFLFRVPFWRTGSVFFEKCCPRSLIQRVQVYDGPAWQCAVITTLYYAACRYKAPGADYPRPLDMKAYLAKHAPPEMLYRYVRGKGADSATLLGHLSGRGKLRRYALTDLDDDMLVKKLEAYGPALISQFRLFRSFGRDDCCRLLYPVYHSTDGPQHAMVLVGWRKTHDGSVLYLVQNSWRGFQFFDCTKVFLQSRYAQLSWVQGEPQQQLFPQSTCATRTYVHEDCEEISDAEAY